MRDFLKLTTAALLALAPIAAEAQVGIYVIDNVEVEASIINYATATSSAGCTVGTKGCIASTSFASATSIDIAGPDSDLAMMPIPTRVQVDLFDSGANGTLVCTAQILNCVNAAGFEVEESMGALSESGDLSSNVCRKVTRYRASGCSGGGASDVIRLSTNELEIGLPVMLQSDNDLLGLAWRLDATTDNWHTCRSGFTRVGGGYGINFSACTWEGNSSPGNTDTIHVMARGKKFLKTAGGN